MKRRPWPKEFEGLVVRPMEERHARLRRLVCTHYELHKKCPFRCCIRANACATRNVVCYQAVRHLLQPVVQSMLAHYWQRQTAMGKHLDVAPAYADMMTRLLAWEEAEARRERGEAADLGPDFGPDFGYDPDRRPASPAPEGSPSAQGDDGGEG